MRFVLSILLAASFFLPSAARAWCFEEAGVRYGASPILLRAIASHESRFNEKLILRNKDGSVDMGLMGINSFWFKDLSKFGITPKSLLNACTNIMVGAWILSLAVKKHGMTWKAVGVYHSPGSPARQVLYANQIYAEIRRLSYGKAS